MESFNRSIGFDKRLYKEEIEASLAHAEMLGKCGIISMGDAAMLKVGLKSILEDIENGSLVIDPFAEDIHTFVETELTFRIGGAGKRLHTGRSRNDQAAAVLRLYTKKTMRSILYRITDACEVLGGRIREHAETVMPGYTHLQRAQPVTLAIHLGAWREMLWRDGIRAEDIFNRVYECPLGAGALAGTTYPIDRGMTAKALGFIEPCRNTMDAVSDRDFVLDALSALSILMVHLSRMAEELILWCSSEFGFVTLPDEFTTGSSIMPQKKNPDGCELIRGKSGRVFGHLMGMLTVMKGLPLTYNKDMQEDKEALFDALDTVSACLEVFIPMIAGAEFHPGRMRASCSQGFLNATDCADYLVGKGMPFREAHGVVKHLVEHCAGQGKTLETLELEEYRKYSGLFSDDIYEAVDLDNCVKRRKLM
jgi:argininosuccinate lyase